MNGQSMLSDDGFSLALVVQDSGDWQREMEVVRGVDNDERCTCVVAASFQPLTAEALQQANATAGRGDAVTQIMAQDAFAAWLNSEKGILLTDDFVPVDNLTAPLFLESR